jgi:hypothetical protein
MIDPKKNPFLPQATNRRETIDTVMKSPPLGASMRRCITSRGSAADQTWLATLSALSAAPLASSREDA